MAIVHSGQSVSVALALLSGLSSRPPRWVWSVHWTFSNITPKLCQLIVAADLTVPAASLELSGRVCCRRRLEFRCESVRCGKLIERCFFLQICFVYINQTYLITVNTSLQQTHVKKHQQISPGNLKKDTLLSKCKKRRRLINLIPMP